MVRWRVLTSVGIILGTEGFAAVDSEVSVRVELLGCFEVSRDLEHTLCAEPLVGAPVALFRVSDRIWRGSVGFGDWSLGFSESGELVRR